MKSGEPKYDKKTMAAFEGTTAAKVLSVRLDGVAYHALHAKEPKTPEAAELLAKFLAAHAAACGAGPFAWLVDTNLAEGGDELGLPARKSRRAASRCRRACRRPPKRSRLHGQCYDDNKCHKTVVAAKDVFVVTDGALTLLPTVPDLADEAHPVTLPRETWPADLSRRCSRPRRRFDPFPRSVVPGAAYDVPSVMSAAPVRPRSRCTSSACEVETAGHAVDVDRLADGAWHALDS